MPDWLPGALEYLPRWIEFQMRLFEQPGCVIAVAHQGHLVLETALGCANLRTGERLTPRHRFRVGSHSKTFTAAGVMKLRERGTVGLDDGIGQHVPGLHPTLAETRLTQLLSHTSGLVRDGTTGDQWFDRRPFADVDELSAAFAGIPTIEANTRFKYSNYGYGLLGRLIESVTGEPYAVWIQREIVDAAALTETTPDMPVPNGVPMASGHSGKLPLGHRIVLPGHQTTNALAPATGFVSTAGDLARFFARLVPSSPVALLTVASRREMTRAQWRNPHSTLERHYGLGTMSGGARDWWWFGHAGAFQGFLSQTAALPAHDITIAIVTNAIDGYAYQVAGWRAPRPRDLREAWRRHRGGARLGRPMVEHLERHRSGAHGREGAGREPGVADALHRCQRDHGLRAGPRNNRGRQRLRQSRRDSRADTWRGRRGV